MRLDLEESFKRALEDNDKNAIWNCIYEACHAQLINYINAKGVYLNEEAEYDITMDSTESIFSRVMYGFKRGEKKGQKLRPALLGAYAHSVVTMEYIRYVTAYLNEKEYKKQLIEANKYLIKE